MASSSPPRPPAPEALAEATLRPLEGGDLHYHSLEAAAELFGVSPAALPLGIRILLENRLRHAAREPESTLPQVEALLRWPEHATAPDVPLVWFPARVLLQDFTGVPAVADLAALRDAIAALGGDPSLVRPLVPADLVVDHSLIVESFRGVDPAAENRRIEYERNRERYRFLKWGQGAFSGFRVVPPGTGIVHQVNLEILAEVVRVENGVAHPDTAVGTDSHTTMVNALGVLAWGVGGIEAEAAMLGQGLSLSLPKVVGVRLTGTLPHASTATDLVLAVTERLRAHGVVSKLIEFFGSGVASLTLPDRATLSNMAPEYGATAALFPIDGETLSYLTMTGRPPALVARVEAYARALGLWLDPSDDTDGGEATVYSETLEIDLTQIEPALAGPSRPQDRVLLSDLAASVAAACPNATPATPPDAASDAAPPFGDGSLVIAAITSCTNTSNPYGLIAAGLVAKAARARGLAARPWVKTSLAPGSQTVPRYLEEAGLLTPLAEVGFRLVGFGCTTCIGNSGPLAPGVEEAIAKDDLATAAILSGNRNFEGRVHPSVRLNYLTSPMLVVAASLAGDLRRDLVRDPLAFDTSGAPVFLSDLLPDRAEIEALVARCVRPEFFREGAATLLEGDAEWRALEAPAVVQYPWEADSTYVRRPPFLDSLARTPSAPPDLEGARILALLGDSITTDHISPAGAIRRDTPAADWLEAEGVSPHDFNAFGARRGNHEVMLRGTFGSPRLRNLLLGGEREGGFTRHFPSGEEMTIFAAAERYRAEAVPLVVIAGREYGTGSSRDWAAKGTLLLGVRAVLAQSFERIHRSNLVGMGVLPLEPADGVSLADLNLVGDEQISIADIATQTTPRARLEMILVSSDGTTRRLAVATRIDTPDELETFRHGGILPRVARTLAA